MTAKATRDTASICSCGFRSKRTTRGLAEHALRLHSCARWREIARARAAGDILRARAGTIIRDCQCARAHHQHGTYVAYKIDGCRCTPCAQAPTVYSRVRDRRTAYGTWQPYVDAEPARQHVRHLMSEGVGWKRIADEAGISHGAMTKLLYGQRTRGMGPSKRIRPDTERRLLDVNVTAIAGGARIPAHDTWTQICGMVALGHSLSWISEQIGQGGRALQIDRRTCTVRNARLIDELAEQVGNTPGPSTRARRMAERYGWLPPQPDIDDVDVEIDVPRQSRTAALREDIAFLTAAGVIPEVIADRLGCSADYVASVLKQQTRIAS